MLTHPAYQGRRLQPAFRELTFQGDIILEGAWRLDAFSAYPFPT